MKTISILVPESAVMETVADPRYLFTTANQFQTAAGNDPLFKVELVAKCPEVKLHGGIYTVHADKLLTKFFDHWKPIEFCSSTGQPG